MFRFSYSVVGGCDKVCSLPPVGCGLPSACIAPSHNVRFHRICLISLSPVQNCTPDRTSVKRVSASRICTYSTPFALSAGERGFCKPFRHLSRQLSVIEKPRAPRRSSERSPLFTPRPGSSALNPGNGRVPQKKEKPACLPRSAVPREKKDFFPLVTFIIPQIFRLSRGFFEKNQKIL